MINRGNHLIYIGANVSKMFDLSMSNFDKCIGIQVKRQEILLKMVRNDRQKKIGIFRGHNIAVITFKKKRNEMESRERIRMPVTQ